MGRRHHLSTTKSHTLPSSPTHSFSSSSSSDFEFTISLSPRKSSAALCPADELFYKGQLLPLHHHSRLSMVRTLLLSSSSTSSSSRDSTTTASRDSSSSDSSTASADLLLHHHLDCDSSRPSSVADDEIKPLNATTTTSSVTSAATTTTTAAAGKIKQPKYFSLSKFSSVFRKDTKTPPPPAASSGGGGVKRVSSTAKDVIRKYLKKVKPLYEKLSQKQNKMSHVPTPSRSANTTLCIAKDKDSDIVNCSKENVPLSFSGNLGYPRRKRSCISSCPSSMRSSPSHAKNGYGCGYARFGSGSDNSSSMEELQSAIQGAIAHCKNSMMQSKISNEI